MSKDIIIRQLKTIGTGSHSYYDECNHIIVYPFGKYEIKIALNERNEFIGVTEVRTNKSFLGFKQKSQLKGYHDVEEYYNE